MPSFDVVSKVDLAEVDNALNQAKKEIGQRYDFRGTTTELERTPEGIVLRSSDKEHLAAAYKVMMERLVKRNVSLRALDPQEPEPAAKQSLRQLVLIKQGISTEKGKEINKLIKDSKLKVQSQIQDEQVRVTGKNKDDLQAAMRLLRGATELDLDLQFTNFRD
jgi:cyclic-di-GMP-binding protein